MVADEDEEVDEEEDEDEEAPENIGYRQAAPYGQQPAAYRQQQPAGYRQQQSVGHGQSAAYEQGYGQAYRQPDPYQGQDYQMAQRAALGLRVRPAQVLATQVPCIFSIIPCSALPAGLRCLAPLLGHMLPSIPARCMQRLSL